MRDYYNALSRTLCSSEIICVPETHSYAASAHGYRATTFKRTFIDRYLKGRRDRLIFWLEVTEDRKLHESLSIAIGATRAAVDALRVNV